MLDNRQCLLYLMIVQSGTVHTTSLPWTSVEYIFAFHIKCQNSSPPLHCRIALAVSFSGIAVCFIALCGYVCDSLSQHAARSVGVTRFQQNRICQL